MNNDDIKKMYLNLVSVKLQNSDDRARMMQFFDSLITFYPQVLQDSKITTLFKHFGLLISDASIAKILQSKQANMNSQLMDNNEFRCRLIDGDSNYSYVYVIDTRNKQVHGSHHQNSHEHFYTIEVCRVESGYAIAATLLQDNNKVKLVRYNPGEYWTSIPGYVHNTSLKEGSHTTTLKTGSPLQDWYGTGNIINSKLSYYVDSRSKTLDLDEMNYIIERKNGIVSEDIVKEFKLDDRYQNMISKTIKNPYEILITPGNREQMRQLLLVTSDNDIAAFYALLTGQKLDKALNLANMTSNDLNYALYLANKSDDFDDYSLQKAVDFAKDLNQRTGKILLKSR